MQKSVFVISLPILQITSPKIWPKKSEYILEYYQKYEIVFFCIFVIKNDLNMMKITGGLSKMFAQLSGTTKFWKKMAKW